VSHDGRPVLSDFGFSRTVIGNTIWTGTTPMKGNVRWMAYELLIPQTRTNESLMDSRHQFHTKESDIWAFGMITYVSTAINLSAQINRVLILC
jgi:serine/threonine protein kinase